MNASPDCVSKRNMNQNRLNHRPTQYMWLIHIFILIMGVSLAGIAVGAEGKFSLYKSTDHGTSWTKVGPGLVAEARINALSMVKEVVIAGTDRGIFVSHDAGANWQPSQNGPGTEARVLSFARHAGRLVAGTQNHGVLASDDAGRTWNAVNQGLTDLYVRSLLIVGTRFYAGTDRRGVFVSEDGGASWTNHRAGLPDSAQVFDLASVDGTVFAGLYSQGLYRWDAERGLWVKSGEVAPLEIVAAGKLLVAGHNPGGVFVSEDRGKTWQDGNSGLPLTAPIWTLAADGKQVWAGTTGKVGLGPDEAGLFVSQDRGKSWTRSDTGLPPSSAAVSFLVSKSFILAGIFVKDQK